MTQSEKDALVSAFSQHMATFHNANFGDIHSNLPVNPQLDVFLAWHRRIIFEIEQAMQDINSSISIPFWDWTVDNSASSSLWGQDVSGT